MIAEQFQQKIAELTEEVRRRSEVEARLRSESSLLAVTLASIGDAVLTADTAGRVMFLNSEAERLTGWTAADARGQPLEDVFRIINEYSRQPVENPVQSVLRDGVTVGLANHTVLLQRSGGEIPIDDSAAPIQDEKGQLIGVVLIFRDVTERRRADETRRRLAAIVESSEDAIVGKDLNGIITSWNRGAEQLYGYTAAEIIGQSFALLVPAERHAEVERTAQRLQRGERVDHFETVRRRKDGQLIDVQVSYSPIRDSDGHRVGTAVIARDISDRKRLERRRTARLAITQILAEAASVEEAVPRVLEAVCENLEWDVGAFWIHDQPADEIRCIGLKFCGSVQADEFEEMTWRLRFRSGEGLPGRVVAENKPAWIADVLSDGNFPRAAVAAKGNLHGAFACPVFLNRTVLGVIEFFSHEVREPDADLLEMLTTLGGQLGQFIERRRTEAALREEARTIETLYRIGRTLAAELDLQKIVQVVTDEATNLTGAQFGAFFYNLLNERGEAYTLYTLSGVPREAFAHFPMPRNTEIFEPTFRGTGTVRLGDVTLDARYGKNAPHHGMPHGHLPVRSYLAVPVLSRSGAVLGGLFFGHPEADVFSERHERLVEGIASHAAVAIDNARLYGQVRESESRLAAIINHSPAIIFLKDAEGRYQLVNRGFEVLARSLGIDGPYLGRTDAELLPAELAAKFRADDLEVMRSKQVRTYEEAVVLNGERRTSLTTKFPLLDQQGNVYALCGINLDISDRVRTEEALRDSEERLRLALDAGRMGVWDWNIKTDELKWSDNLEAIHGLTAGAFDGTFEAFQRIIHPEDRELVNAAITRSLAERSSYDIEFRNLWSDGSIHWMAGKGRVFSSADGEPTRMVGVGMDVTQRKRAEQDTRFLADASATLAAVVDYESTLQKVAALAVPFFADWCSVDMLEGADTLRRVAVAHIDPTKVELAHELHRRYPPDREAKQGVWNILRTGKSEFISEISDELLVASVKDPELLEIMRRLGLRSYMGVPLNVRGKTLGVITFIAAESGRRYAASDLAIAEDLAHRAAVAIENAQLYQALREADRRKDEFLAMLAHELRNPLAPIRNSLQVLKMPGADRGVIERASEMMERQMQHLVRLVDDLLDVSRVMRGKIDLKRERLSLATVVGRAVETAQPVIDSQGHKLLVTLPARPVELDADPVRLAQVLTNLLTNAAKFTREPGRITLSADAGDSDVVIRVGDTGIGIPRDQLTRIFDLFVQVDQGIGRSQGGLGIGLTLVKNLVEMHGGSVQAHSEGLGRGSEFVIRLPLPARAARHARSDPQGKVDPATPRRRRILVVDDNHDAADSLALLLRLQDQDVRVAYDGPGGLELARQFQPELVFLDIGMPGMDGYELAARLRTTAGLEHIRLAAMTGWGQEEDRRRTQEAGFDIHLVKPVEPERLNRVLAEG